MFILMLIPSNALVDLSCIFVLITKNFRNAKEFQRLILKPKIKLTKIC